MPRARIILGRETIKGHTTYYAGLIIDGEPTDWRKPNEDYGWQSANAPPQYFDRYRETAKRYATGDLKDERVGPGEVTIVNGERFSEEDMRGKELSTKKCDPLPTPLLAHFHGSLEEFLGFRVTENISQ